MMLAFLTVVVDDVFRGRMVKQSCPVPLRQRICYYLNIAFWLKQLPNPKLALIFLYQFDEGQGILAARPINVHRLNVYVVGTNSNYHPLCLND